MGESLSIPGISATSSLTTSRRNTHRIVIRHANSLSGGIIVNEIMARWHPTFSILLTSKLVSSVVLLKVKRILVLHNVA